MVYKKFSTWVQTKVKNLIHRNGIPNWDILSVFDDEPCLFATQMFFANRCILGNNISKTPHNLFHPNNSKGIVIIGHGDEKGAFSSLYPFSKSSYLITESNVKRISYSPIIMWVCYSGTWLSSTDVPDWFGFNNRVGYDLRYDEWYWKSYLKRYHDILFDSAHGLKNIRTLKEFAKNSTVKANSLAKKGSISYLSYLLTKGFEKYAIHSNAFGS